MADNVLERAVRSEPQPKIHISPRQSSPARKHSPIPGFMALTDGKNDPTDRVGEPPGERGHGSKLPDGWFGEPRRLPRPGKSQGEGLKQAPRPPIWRQQHRTYNCSPPQAMATSYHRERTRQHCSMLFGFSCSPPPRSGVRWDQNFLNEAAKIVEKPFALQAHVNH